MYCFILCYNNYLNNEQLNNNFSQSFIVYSFILLQGSEKLRGKIKPNEESAKIDPKIEDNVRQIKTATGKCSASKPVVMN